LQKEIAMQLLKSLLQLPSSGRYIVTMTIIPDGIRIAVTRGGSAVPITDFLTLEKLPETVRTFLQAQRENERGSFRTPFVAAKRLLRELDERSLTPLIELQASEIEALKPTRVPADFRVRWTVDASRQKLIREMDGADGYLGDGCFSRGVNVWRVEGKFSAMLLKCLEMPELPRWGWGALLVKELEATPSPHLQLDTPPDAAVLDAASLPLVWERQHSIVNGVGQYRAVPFLKAGDTPIPLERVEAAIQEGAPAISAGRVQVALTGAFRQRYAEWKAKKLKTFPLFPQEVLGTQKNRLSRLDLTSPVLDVPDGSTDRARAENFIEAMRRHGLPAGLYGLQNEMSEILAGVCRRLLRDSPTARILWVLPRRRRDPALEALDHANLPYTDRPEGLMGRVCVVTPDVKLLPVEWTLIIFSDLDLIAAGVPQNRTYAALSRAWAVATFARPDWGNNRSDAGQLIRVLGFNADDLEAFKRTCTRQFSPQNDTLISRLTSPFRKLIIGEESENNAVPIPKPLPSTPKPAAPTLTPADIDINRVYRPTFGEMPANTGSRGSFVEQARYYAQHSEVSANPIPFRQYFPTYDAMSPAQRRWYFYWRGEVRQQRYPPTDLSYIFLHIYEGLHLVGFESPANAFNHLSTLWQKYRVDYPDLDRYLIDWLADFLVVYKLPRLPLEWYARALTLENVQLDRAIALEAWLKDGQIAAIPDTLLSELCEYKWQKSKFYQQHNTDGALDTAYREALRLIDGHVRVQQGKSLFELYRPEATTPLQRQPFAGAVHEGHKLEITIAMLPDWSASELGGTLASIIKHTENLLRRQRSFKGTLHGIMLPPDWSAVLEAAFPPPAAAPKTTSRKRKTSAQENTPPAVVDDIVIDGEAFKSLIDDNAYIRDLLRGEDEPEESQQAVAQTETASTTEEGFVFDTERPNDTPAHLLTDLAEVAEVIGQDKQVIDLLRLLYEHDWEADEDTAQESIDGAEFCNVIVSRVNERAQDILGDNLIYVEDERLSVTEDYRDEIEHLLTHLQAGVTEAPPESQTAKPISIPQHDALTPEWSDFVQRMEIHHWEALNVLLIRKDVASRLDGVARSRHTMVSLLLNEINAIALDTIGDIVIDASIDPPEIEDEDWADLEALNAWMLQTQQ
jgi:hypothetical protein